MASEPALKIKISADAAEANKAIKGFSGALNTIEKSTSSLTGSMARMGHAMAAAFSIRELAQASDSWASLQGRINLVTSSLEDAGKAMSSVFAIAQKTGTDMASIGDVYQKLSRSARQYGLDQQAVATTTEAIANAVRLSGGAASSAQAALVQFGQALSSGVLRGDELNSVLEQAPALAEAIARGLGKTTGELRKMGEEGALTATAVLGAIRSESGRLEQEAGQMANTVSAAMQRLQNAFTKFAGTEGAGAASVLASGINTLAENLDKAATAAGVLGAAMATQKLATWASEAMAATTAAKAMAAAEILAADAAVAHAVAQTNLRIAQLGTAGSSTVLTLALERQAAAQVASSAAGTGVLGLLSRIHPITLVIGGALAAASIAWKDWSDAATTAGENAASVMRKVATDISKANTEITSLSRQAYDASLKDFSAKRATASGNKNKAQAALDGFTGNRVSTEFNELQMAAAQASLALKEIDDQLTTFRAGADKVGSKPVADYFDKYGSKVKKAGEELKTTEAAYLSTVRRMADDGATPQAMKAITDDYVLKVAEIKKAQGDAGKSARDAADNYTPLIKSLREKTAIEAAGIDTTDTMSAGQKLANKIMADLRDNAISLTETQKLAVATELNRYLVLEKTNQAEKAAAKSAKDRADALGRIVADEDKQVSSMLAANERLKDEIAMLGLSVEQQASYQSEKLKTQAATDALTASQLDEAAVWLETQNTLPEVSAAYRELADAKRNSANSALTQAELINEKSIKQTAVKAAEDSSKAWQKFSDDIERSLTDSLYRSFEAGEGFGETFVKSLKNTLKAAALKLVIQYAVTGTGNLVASAANSVLGTSFNTGGSSGGGTDYASLLSLGSSAWNLYKSGTGGVAGYGVSALGSLTGNLSTQAYGAGMQMTASQASTAAALYTQAATAATTASTNLTLAAAAAEAEGQVALAAYLKAQAAEKLAEAVAAKSTGAGLTSGSSAASTVAWVAAIAMAMKMSNDAYKAGIRWDGTYDFTNDPLKAGPSGPHHERQSQVATAVFGKDFANSEFFATVSGNALSQMVHNLAWGGQITTGVPDMAGTFSEAGQGFTGGKTGQEITEHGGWFTSTKRWWEWKDISSELDKQMDVMYFVISDAFLSFGDLFQDSTMLDKIKGFSLDVRTASNGDTFSVIREQLTSSLGNLLFPAISEIKASAASSVTSLQSEMDQATKLGNTTLATSLKAQIDALSAKVSESWSTTFTRVAQETTSVSTIFAIMGKSLVGVFGQNNANTILKFSDNVVTAFGGIEAMNTAFSTYLTAFMTPAEQLQASINGLGGQFTALDTAMPKTIIGLKALVDGIDFTKAGAADLFKGLIALVPALTQVSESFYTSLTQGPSFGLTDREKAYNSAFDTPAQTASKNIEFLNSTIAGLGLTVPATKDAFVALRNGLDRTKDSGEYAYQVLTAIGPLFASIGTAVADTAVDLVAASTSLSKYLSTERNRTNILTQIKTAAATAGVPLGDESLINLSHATASDFAAFIASIDTGTAAGAKMFGLMADIAPLFEDLLEIQSAALQTQADAIITTYGDVVSAMAEINPPAKTLVDSWRENKTALEGLQSVFDQFFGQSLPDAGANIQALLTQMDAFKNGASTARGNADNARLQGMTPTERAAYWRNQESSLWQGLGQSTDKAGTISQIMEAYGNTRSAELDALTADQTKLNDTQKTGLQAQIDTWKTTLSVIEKAQGFSKSLEQFMGSLAFSDLSALGYTDQLGAAQSLYGTTLAGVKSNDPEAMGNFTGNAQAYLEEAQKHFGGASLDYATIYKQVTGDAGSLGMSLNTDGTGAKSEIDRLTESLNGLTTTLPTDIATAFSNETADGYGRIETALTAGTDYTRGQMDEQKALLQQQIAQQQEIIANQQAQIEQQAALHAELMAQQAAQTARLTTLESNASLAGAGA